MDAILVTGGAGYIGSHACKALALAGYLPIALDNLSTGHEWAVRWGPLVQGEVGDRRLVRETLERYCISAVLHFAANASVGESMSDPFRYLHDNVAGSLVLLEAMRQTGVRRIVFSSSCAVYGIPLETPVSEDAHKEPLSPYGESKLMVERAMQWYERVHSFSWTALRYFNAAGADAERTLGECHDPETHLIPLAIQAALGDGPAVRVMGSDYSTPDGTCVRDYIHVEDLADAHVKALHYLRQGGASIALNLGTARGHSVQEVIAAVSKAGNCRVPVRKSRRRAGDAPCLVADNRRALERLSWYPRHANLDDIVLSAWEWHASQRASPGSMIARS